jgi:hypothetical protein
MALLPPSRYFTAHLLVDGRLRVNEAFQVEWIRDLRLLSRGDAPWRGGQFRSLEQMHPTRIAILIAAVDLYTRERPHGAVGSCPDRHNAIRRRNTIAFRRSFPRRDNDSV